MREFYKMFYRTKGARYAASLIRPSRFHMSELPKDAIFHHYVAGDGASPDIEAENPLFSGYTKKILFKNINQYVDPEGSFRTPPVNMVTMTASWRRAHSKNWMVSERPWRVTESVDQLVVINYGYLDACNLYMPVQLAKLWRWRNTMRTIFATMNMIASESSRQQFIIIKSPKQIQGKTVLDRFAPRPDNVTLLNLFTGEEDDGLMQVEFWRWLLSEERSKSLINQIEEKNYGVINFVFEGHAGNQIVVNLAYLYSWIKGNENRTEMNSVSQFPEETIRKLYLKMLMSLNEISEEKLEAQATEELKEAEASETRLPISKTSSDAEAVETDGFALPEGDDAEEEQSELASAPMSIAKKDTKSKLASYAEIEALDKKIRSPENYSKELLDEVDEDISMLDKLSLQQIRNKGINIDETEPSAQADIPEMDILPRFEEVEAKIFKTTSPSEMLQKRLAEEAENNTISAADFRRMSESAKKYHESKDPYGSNLTRAEAMVIKPEELLLDKESKDLGDSNQVADKTMTRSSLVNFDKHYVKNVLKKDVLSAVDALQSTGVVIRNHEVERTTSALGTYEHHRLELKPIDGASSTVNFTLPVVDKDGSYLAGGNKYLLRKQRVD